MITSVAKIFIPWLDNEILTLALSNKSWPTAGKLKPKKHNFKMKYNLNHD